MFEPMVSKPFPYLPMPDIPAEIRLQQENVKDLDITLIELDNHIRLNLKQTDFTKGKLFSR